MKLCWEAMGGAPGSCVRGLLTFTPPPRLLRLEAMVLGLKMVSKSVWQMCLGQLGASDSTPR